MGYFHYHAVAKKLIREGKLLSYAFTPKYKNISPALVLYFSDETHPIMPIRKERWEEYFSLLPKDPLQKIKK